MTITFLREKEWKKKIQVGDYEVIRIIANK